MKPFYLHIGPFKTGTTALQVFFARNIPALSAQGISYLKMGNIDAARAGNITSGNGAFLARSLLPDADVMALPDKRPQLIGQLQRLMAETGESSPLVSSEFFSDIPYENFAMLHDLITDAGYALTPIMFVREQVSALEALYIQRVKRRHLTDTPADFIRETYKTVEHLHYGRYCRTLSDIVGPQNIHVAAYGGPDIFDAVSAFLNIDAVALDRPERSLNVSLNPQQLVIMRELNKFRPRQSFADQLVENEALLGSTRSRDKISVVPPKVRDEVQGYFAAENQALSDDYFKGAPLFDTAPAPYVDLDSIKNDMGMDTIVDMLGGLMVRQEDRLCRVENTLRQLMAAKT